MAIDEETIEAAKIRSSDAAKRLSDIDEDVTKGEGEFQIVLAPSTEVQKCQRAIELYAKALLDLSGVNFPKTHEISVQEGYAEDCITTLEAELDEEAGTTAYRAFVIASIWSGAYPATEYGVAGKSPDRAFSLADAEMAYEHAIDVRERVNSTIEKASSRYLDEEDE